MRVFGRWKGAALALALAGLPAAAEAASFDCAKAAAPDEIAICASRALDDADVEMTTRYDMLLQLLAMGAAGDLRDSQRAFLKTRAACGSDDACLAKAYADRIAALKKGFAGIVAMGPF
jgi:uncharacterized protein